MEYLHQIENAIRKLGKAFLSGLSCPQIKFSLNSPIAKFYTRENLTHHRAILAINTLKNNFFKRSKPSEIAIHCKIHLFWIKEYRIKKYTIKYVGFHSRALFHEL